MQSGMFGEDEDEDRDEFEMELTPIERAIDQERAMMRLIRNQQIEIERLEKALAERSTQLVAATESSSAWMLQAALGGAFTKKSVEAMGDLRPDTLSGALVNFAAREAEKSAGSK